MHRTPHINDYLIALAGELTMYLEDGSSVKFTAGDMLVQLAGWHSWKNEGAEPFVMAGVVIGIKTDENVPYGVEMAKRRPDHAGQTDEIAAS
jgi:quercetin dioxygenase-like cupin family protein